MKRTLLATAAAAALAFTAGTAHAYSVLSGDGIGNETYTIGPSGTGLTGFGVGATGAAVVLSNTLPSAWFDFNTQGTPADWISFDAGTGNGTKVPSNIQNLGGGFTDGRPTRIATGQFANYTALFTEDLPVGGDPLPFTARIWADDTAEVYLLAPDSTRTLLLAANQAQVDPCSGSPIGCATGDDGLINFVLNQQGTWKLEIYAFQTNADGFGVRYEGTVVPVPAALPLMLTALAGLGLIARRKSDA